MSDTYAVVDKTKKNNASNDGSCSQQLHQDSMTDVYAVVDKTRKIKEEPSIMGNYDVITTDAMTTTVADDIDLYDYASAPVYGKLDSSQSETMETKLRHPNKCYENCFGKLKCQEHHSVFILTSIIVLVTAVILAVVAVAIAFVLIAGLRFDLTTALKVYSSSSGSSSENVKCVTNSLEPQLNQLRTDFNNFTTETHQQVFHWNKNISDNAEDLNQQINSTLKLIKYLNDSSNMLLSSSVNALERRIHEQQNNIYNNATTKIRNLNSAVVEELRNASNISLTTINTLTDKLANGIQDLHIFNSCAAVSAFPIQLPSGMYNIRSRTSTSYKYCSTTIAFSCNSIPGKWRRIAYLNINENPEACSDEFEVISDNPNPPLCRRMDTSAGCSSMVYPSNGMSYSQVCGAVRVHPARTPDGFMPRNGQSVNENYVDGVSLTYGTSSNRNHIWTYTAAVTIGGGNRECGNCNEKPRSTATNFTCTTAYCDNANTCFIPDTLWGSEAQQCFGNETFYRQLSESTTDNIEMRVCRDQGRGDEDILISFVELFVM